MDEKSRNIELAAPAYPANVEINNTPFTPPFILL